MIGCLIFGSLAAMGIARAIHHRRFYGGGCGGWHASPPGTATAGTAVGTPATSGGRSTARTGANFARRSRTPTGGAGRVRAGAAVRRQAVLRPPDPRARARHAGAGAAVVSAAFEEFRDEMKRVGGGEGRRSRQGDRRTRCAAADVRRGRCWASSSRATTRCSRAARKAFVGLVAKIHDALEPEQRERLADLVERGPRFGCVGAGRAGRKAYQPWPCGSCASTTTSASTSCLRSYLEPNGVTLVHAADGAKGLAALGRGRLRCRAARRDDAGDGRARGLPAHPPAEPGAGHHADGARRRGRPGGGARARRRRLRRRSRSRRASCWRGCARCLRRAQPAAVGAEIVVGRVAIDVGARQVRVGGEPVELTGLEFDILVALARRPGRVVPRETLLGEAGRNDVTVSDRTVDVHVSHLRRKLGDDPKTPRLIKTVRGVGYVLSPEAARGRRRRVRRDWPPRGHGLAALARPLAAAGGTSIRRCASGSSPSCGRPTANGSARRAIPGTACSHEAMRAAARLAAAHRAGSCGCTTGRTCTGGCSSGSARRSSSPSWRPLLAAHFGHAWLAAHPAARRCSCSGFPALVLWTAAGRVARRISRPLYELTRAAQELGAGNLAARRRSAAGFGFDETACCRRRSTTWRAARAPAGRAARAAGGGLARAAHAARAHPPAGRDRPAETGRRRAGDRRANARRDRARGDRDRHAGGRAAGERAARVPGASRPSRWRRSRWRAARSSAAGEDAAKLAAPAAASPFRRRPDAGRRARSPT